jgi:hypothetical protein
LANKRKKRYNAAKQQAADELAVADGSEESDGGTEAKAPTRPAKRPARAPRAVLEKEGAPTRPGTTAARASRLVVDSDDDVGARGRNHPVASPALVRRLKGTTHAAPKDVIVISDDE